MGLVLYGVCEESKQTRGSRNSFFISCRTAFLTLALHFYIFAFLMLRFEALSGASRRDDENIFLHKIFQ